MQNTIPTADRVLNSGWFTGGLLAAATLLVSPTFVLGYIASTPLRAALLLLPTAAFGAVFHVVFEGSTPVGVDEVTEAYRSLALWTSIVGSLIPYAAGVVFQRGWRSTSARQAAVLMILAFSILAAGSHFVTEKADALSAVSNVAVGRSQALAVVEAEASEINRQQPNSGAAQASRLLATRVTERLLGIVRPRDAPATPSP